jgi:hypothetical protein
MEHAVLIVDNSYKPVRTATWEDAIVDVLKNRYSVLEYSDRYVNSAHAKWYLPEIIVSPSPLRIRKSVRFDYDTINYRDNHVCAYCGCKGNTVDHIVPKKLGGKNSWMNCITACWTCNNKKDSRTPEQAGMPLLYQPIEPANTLEFNLYRLRLKDEWVPYMSSTVIRHVEMLKDRTRDAREYSEKYN